MNTEVNYMYRDASNYKASEFVVVSGTLTESEKKEIFAKLDGENFIAEQVGLPSFCMGDTEDDHCWHEMCAIVETDARPTEVITANEVLEAFRNVTFWDDVTYARGF